jgi:hypothetical protein
MSSLDSIRERLRDIFDPALMQTYAKIMLRGYVLPDDMFCPFVPYVFDEYAEMKIKLMVVGKQRNGWGITMGDAIRKRLLFDDLSQDTKSFANGTGNRTHFFQFAFKLNERLNGKHDLGWIWENLGKIEHANDLPDPPIKQFNEQEFCILGREIETVGVDVVVFTTGPGYDKLLMQQVFYTPDPTPSPFEAVRGYDVTELAEIKGLPCKAYRCYHPDHLRFKPGGSKQTLDTLSSLIGAG